MERELQSFEDELRQDLIRLAELNGTGIYRPALVSKAITRLVFAMAETAMDQPPERQAELMEQMITMLRMIITGTQAMSGGQVLRD